MRKTKSLKTTQNYYNETKSLKPVEIKEFSLLYLILKKPELIRDNYHLIKNVKLFSNENKLCFDEILKQTNNLENIEFDNLRIEAFEPIKSTYEKFLRNIENSTFKLP